MTKEEFFTAQQTKQWDPLRNGTSLEKVLNDAVGQFHLGAEGSSPSTVICEARNTLELMPSPHELQGPVSSDLPSLVLGHPGNPFEAAPKTLTF